MRIGICEKARRSYQMFLVRLEIQIHVLGLAWTSQYSYLEPRRNGRTINKETHKHLMVTPLMVTPLMLTPLMVTTLMVTPG